MSVVTREAPASRARATPCFCEDSTRFSLTPTCCVLLLFIHHRGPGIPARPGLAAPVVALEAPAALAELPAAIPGINPSSAGLIQSLSAGRGTEQRRCKGIEIVTYSIAAGRRRVWSDCRLRRICFLADYGAPLAGSRWISSVGTGMLDGRRGQLDPVRPAQWAILSIDSICPCSLVTMLPP